MNYPLVVLASLGSTAFFALATALKHSSARALPRVRGLGPRGLVKFMLATSRHPLWLGGIACDVGGVALQVLALHFGALAVVQPLLVSALVFSLVLNHRIAHTRITGRELTWAVVLALALAGFLIISGAASPTNVAQTVDRMPAVFAALVAVGLAGTCVVMARRVHSGAAAALIGVATGTTYACTAALIKSCTDLFVRSPLILLTSWQLYVLILAGGIGLLLSQLAFQAGPLTASLPAIATVDPLLSIALGVVVYDEQLRSTAIASVGEVTCLVLMSAAAFVLSRVGSQPKVAGSADRTAAPAVPAPPASPT